MAFGKPTYTVRIKDQVKEDEELKKRFYQENLKTRDWLARWQWLLDEYKEYSKKSLEITQTSQFLADVRKGQKEIKDDRRIAPIPETINHQYGWIPSKEEFRLDFAGSDLDKALPLPEIFKIFKN